MALELNTDAILRVLTEKTIGEHGSCRLDALMAADIPQGIKSFFNAEVRRRLEEDLGKSSWFTGIRQSDAGSARMAQALIVSLTNAYQLTRLEFLDTLDLAVHFVANYLCRPQWTLENFLFDRAPRISVAALSEGLMYLADYRYLGDLAVRSLRHRGQIEISRENFQVLIGRIDEEVIRQHNARELASLTRPLFMFFQIPGTRPDGAIPVEALLIFFDDKKLRILKEYIRGICHLRGLTHVTFEELTQLVEDLFAGKPAVQTAPDSPPGQAPPISPASERGTDPPPQPALERTGSAGETHRANIALSLTFAGLQRSLAPRSALPEISTLMQPEQRDRFVTQVFRGDAAHFAEALVMLDSLKTWSDAQAYLEALCRTNNLDPHAGDVVEFMDTIRRRYAISERVPK